MARQTRPVPMVLYCTVNKSYNCHLLPMQVVWGQCEVHMHTHYS